MTSFTCPIPIFNEDIITLSHGSGGKQTSDLIEKLFLSCFTSKELKKMHDAAFLPQINGSMAFTTDSFVVDPIFFPGGDIGSLAVTGTANDLAVSGARPLYLSCAFIIEEGFLQSDLKKIAMSMQDAALSQGVQIVAGDTKIIERTTGKNIFINTTGIGVHMTGSAIGPNRIEKGDVLIVSGDIGRHGMAIMAKRNQLQFKQELISDCAPLFPAIEKLIINNIDIRCMRDITRGGLATTLVELSEQSGKNLVVKEELIPIYHEVSAACEILGIDPLFVACEGRFLLLVPHKDKQKTLDILHSFQENKSACAIGEVTADGSTSAVLSNPYGIQRPLYKLYTEQLPRIC